MKLFDSLHFALKNLFRKKLSNFLTIFAIFIFSLSLITMISLVLGASNVFRQQFESIGALTQVTVVPNIDATGDDFYGGHGGNNGDAKKLDDALVKQIEAVAHVTAVSPELSVYPLQSFQLKGDASGKKYADNNTRAYQPNGATAKKRICCPP